MLAWLSVWSEVQTCIWPSWCHCPSLSLASVKSRLVLLFWYRLTRVVLDKGPLNVCVRVTSSLYDHHHHHQHQSTSTIVVITVSITNNISNTENRIYQRAESRSAVSQSPACSLDQRQQQAAPARSHSQSAETHVRRTTACLHYARCALSTNTSRRLTQLVTRTNVSARHRTAHSGQQKPNLRCNMQEGRWRGHWQAYAHNTTISLTKDSSCL